jgi:hypothetical protein
LTCGNASLFRYRVTGQLRRDHRLSQAGLDPDRIESEPPTVAANVKRGPQHAWSELQLRRTCRIWRRQSSTTHHSYDRAVTDPEAISTFLQDRLTRIGVDEVSAVEAAVWLHESGLLRDSDSRPGLPLRNLLRKGVISAAEQRPPRPNGRWFIVRAGRSRTARSDAVRDTGPLTARQTDAISRPERSGEPVVFTAEGLRAFGFVGFERFKGLDLNRVPTGAGVYVVLRESDARPTFLESNPAGWFKGRDPTVPIAELETAWPDGARCVYIGKADVGRTGRRGLRKRIREFRRYGDGEPVAHQGGRRIWQLADADDYIIAWQPTDRSDAAELEGRLIRAFVAAYGRRPIGNRTSGRRDHD